VKKAVMMYFKMRYSAVVSCLLLLYASSVNVKGSAIPMWEFLSRGEKVSLCLYHELYDMLRQTCLRIVVLKI
jgi:hypothetical protein